MWQKYFTPYSLADALQLLSEYHNKARLVAGGTDLVIEIERGLRAPEAVIDLTHIPDLGWIRLDRHDRIHLGPLVTHNQVVASALCMERAFPLVKACWEVGAPQIRNQGTVAGNLVTASPANDTITPLWALDAVLTLQSVRGSREVPFNRFFQGVRNTDLADDEMIVDISFRALSEGEKGTFLKLGLRRAQAISIVNVAMVLGLDGVEVTSAQVALGSVAPTIIRAPDAEDYLAGKRLTPDVVAEAGRLTAASAAPISDVRGSAGYRHYMIATLARNALEALASGTERQAVPQKPVLLWGKSDGRFSTALATRPVMAHTTGGDEPIDLVLNGRQVSVRGANGKTLLRMLRENAGLTGTKEGCAEGECGACTVFLDGIAVMSCMTPAPQAHGRRVLTVEGLANGDVLHPVQQGFVDRGAVQCGYCTPGFIMSGASLLDELESPSADELRQAITGNLCRCTGYYKILAALEQAADAARSAA